nr:MAG TPA: hypothetical protein [Caudoviricetes sp.]
MVVPAAALEERQLPVSAEAMAKRAEIRRASMQQVVLDRERPQGSSEKAPGNCMLAAAEEETMLMERCTPAVKAAAETALTQCRWDRGLRLRQEAQTPAAVAAEDLGTPPVTLVLEVPALCA